MCNVKQPSNEEVEKEHYYMLQFWCGHTRLTRQAYSAEVMQALLEAWCDWCKSVRTIKKRELMK